MMLLVRLSWGWGWEFEGVKCSRTTVESRMWSMTRGCMCVCVCAARGRGWRGLWLCRSSHSMICCMRKAICVVFVVVSSRARLLNRFKFDFGQLWSKAIDMNNLLDANCRYVSLDETASANVKIVELWVSCYFLLEYTHFLGKLNAQRVRVEKKRVSLHSNRA